MKKRSKIALTVIAMTMLALGVFSFAQVVQDRVKLFYFDDTKEDIKRAVDAVEAANGDIHVLMSWTEKISENINPAQFSIALVDKFRDLKAKEAIPFLIRNIQMLRCQACDPWRQRNGALIEERSPAVAALIAIGPAARMNL